MKPLDELYPDRVYFNITEVTQIIGVPASTIRFWEKEFDQLSPRKNAKGDRHFNREDILQLRHIKFLLKEEGYTIEGAKQKLRKRPKNKDEQLFTLIEKLENIHFFLKELRKSVQ